MTANLSESAARGSSTPALTQAVVHRAAVVATARARARRVRMASVPFIRRPLRRAPELPAGGDLFLECLDESPRHMGRISTRTKRVLPLPIAQPIEQAARPRQIGRGDPLAHELLVPSAIMKRDVPVLDAQDERVACERI